MEAGEHARLLELEAAVSADVEQYGACALADKARTAKLSAAIQDKFSRHRALTRDLDLLVEEMDSDDEERQPAVTLLAQHKAEYERLQGALRAAALAQRATVLRSAADERRELLAGGEAGLRQRRAQRDADSVALAEDVTGGLRRTRQVLAEELDHTSATLAAMEQSHGALGKTRDEYTGQHRHLRRSKGLLGTLNWQAKSDTYMLWMGLTVFLAVCAYVFAKRAGHFVPDRLKPGSLLGGIMGSQPLATGHPQSAPSPLRRTKPPLPSLTPDHGRGGEGRRRPPVPVPQQEQQPKPVRQEQQPAPKQVDGRRRPLAPVQQKQQTGPARAQPAVKQTEDDEAAGPPPPSHVMPEAQHQEGRKQEQRHRQLQKRQRQDLEAAQQQPEAEQVQPAKASQLQLEEEQQQLEEEQQQHLPDELEPLPTPEEHATAEQQPYEQQLYEQHAAPAEPEKQQADELPLAEPEAAHEEEQPGQFELQEGEAATDGEEGAATNEPQHAAKEAAAAEEAAMAGEAATAGELQQAEEEPAVDVPQQAEQQEEPVKVAEEADPTGQQHEPAVAPEGSPEPGTEPEAYGAAAEAEAAEAAEPKPRTFLDQRGRRIAVDGPGFVREGANQPPPPSGEGGEPAEMRAAEAMPAQGEQPEAGADVADPVAVKSQPRDEL